MELGELPEGVGGQGAGRAGDITADEETGRTGIRRAGPESLITATSPESDSDANMSYRPGQALTDGTGSRLRPAMLPPLNRYLVPSQRDFLAVTAR